MTTEHTECTERYINIYFSLSYRFPSVDSVNSVVNFHKL